METVHPSPGSGAGGRAGSEIRLPLRRGGVEIMSQMSRGHLYCVCVSSVCAHTQQKVSSTSGVFNHPSPHSFETGSLTEPSVHQMVRLTGRNTRNVCLSVLSFPHLCSSYYQPRVKESHGHEGAGYPNSEAHA